MNMQRCIHVSLILSIDYGDLGNCGRDIVKTILLALQLRLQVK